MGLLQAFRDTREDENPVAYVEQPTMLLFCPAELRKGHGQLRNYEIIQKERFDACSGSSLMQSVGIFSANKLDIVISRLFVRK